MKGSFQTWLGRTHNLARMQAATRQIIQPLRQRVKKSPPRLFLGTQ
jgi:hypothetical protein